MFLYYFLIVSITDFFLFVSAGDKSRNGEISMYQFSIPADWGVDTFSLQNVPKVLATVVFSLFILLC